MTDLLRPRHSRSSLLACLCLAGSIVAFLPGCSSFEFDSTGPGDTPTSLQLFGEVPEDQFDSDQGAVRVEEGGDVLLIRNVQIALVQLEFGRTSGECVDSTSPNDGDACSEVLTDPSDPGFIEVPVAQQASQLTGPIAVEPGTYDRLEFDFHPVEQTDSGLLTQGFALGQSVIIEGSFNGQELEDGDNKPGVQFAPDVSLQLPLDATLQLAVDESGAITLTADVASWFLSGGELLDPVQAASDPGLRDTVEQNIIASLSARRGEPGS